MSVVSRRLLFLVVAAAVLAGDIATKWLVTSRMELYESHRVVGDLVRLTYIHNSGAAFGLLQGNRWPLVAVSVIAIVVVLVAAFRRHVRTGTLVALGLILGGAAGNLIDRLRLGEVIDFVNVGIGAHRWPVFNLADSAVTVGVVWLALHVARSESRATDDDAPSGENDAGVAAPGPGV